MVSTLDPLSVAPPGMTLPAAVWMGVLASSNVCAVVRLPILAAYLMSIAAPRKHTLTLAAVLVVGLAGGTVLLGLTATPLADGIHRSLQVSKYLFWTLGVCLIVAGVFLSGLVNPQLVPGRWCRLSERVSRLEVPVALLLGLVLGLLQTPACATCRAELLRVMETGPVEGPSGSGFILLVGFAVGQCLMALVVGTLAGLLKPGLFASLRTRMCSVEQHMQLLTGNMLVVLGIYFVIVG